MVKRRLSQILQGVKQGYACDTFEGGFPTSQVAVSPLTADSSALARSIALASGVETTLTTLDFAVQPDVYRVIQVAVNNPALVGSVVTLKGTDWADRNITESITITAPTDNSLQPFKTVYEAVLPAYVAPGDQVSIGYGNALGLYRPLVTSGIDLLVIDGTPSGLDTVDRTHGTYTPTVVPNDVRTYIAYYQTDVF